MRDKWFRPEINVMIYLRLQQMPGLRLSQARDLVQLYQEIQLGFKRDLKKIQESLK